MHVLRKEEPCSSITVVNTVHFNTFLGHRTRFDNKSCQVRSDEVDDLQWEAVFLCASERERVYTDLLYVF